MIAKHMCISHVIMSTLTYMYMYTSRQGYKYYCVYSCVQLVVYLYVYQLLEPIQKKFSADPEAQMIRDKAYPDEGTHVATPALIYSVL